MLSITIYFLYFLFIYRYCHKKYPNTPASFLALAYFISAVMSLLLYVHQLLNNEILTIYFISTLYYLISTSVIFVPMLLFLKYDCRYFAMPYKFMKSLAIIFIILGITYIVQALPTMMSLATVAKNLSDIRNNYYQGGVDSIGDGTLLSLVANVFVYVSFIIPVLFFYFLSYKKYFIVFLLFIASLNLPMSGLVIGEREAVLKWVANYIFAYLFFRNTLEPSYRKKILRLLVFLSIPFLLYLVLMTISRFGERDGGALLSIVGYSGLAPFNFSEFTTIIGGQELYGKLCFGFLFPENVALKGPINDYIQADFFLNVFAGIPGSFILDFGVFTIIVLCLISILLICLLRKKWDVIHNKYSFSQMLVVMSIYQVLFMGIFYYDFSNIYFFSSLLLLCVYNILYKIGSQLYPKSSTYNGNVKH